MGKVCWGTDGFPPPKCSTSNHLLWRSNIMLITVLCRFSVSAGKYFFKIDQRHSPTVGKERGWFRPLNANAATSNSCGCCRSASRQRLIDAIAPCLKVKNAVSFYHEIRVSLHTLARKLWGNLFLLCLTVNIFPVKVRNFKLPNTQVLKTALY